MRYIITLYLLASLIITANAHESYDSEPLLERLDQMIENKATYHAQLEQRTLEIKQKATTTSDDHERCKLYMGLFNEYLHFQADSALLYVEKSDRIAQQLNNYDLQCEIAISRAEVMGVMGMYNETLSELQGVDPRKLSPSVQGYYYRTYRAYYGWVSDYTAQLTAKEKYLRKTDMYRDSVLLVEPIEVNREMTNVEKLITKNNYKEALERLGKLDREIQDDKQRAYINYNYAVIYDNTGDRSKAIYHLAKTAIVDIEMATREYASLQYLAHLLFENGDIERAYRYLNCSMEDAVASNALLRYAQVSKYYPIIDKAYRQQEQMQIDTTRKLLLSISIFAMVLIALLIYLYYDFRKLSMMRRDLRTSYESLQAAHVRLAETGRIKEVYIARYLERCVTYIDKLDIYRRSLKRLASASKIAELVKVLNSEAMLQKERKEFYVEFDRSFLTLFPNFVDDFNLLLNDQSQVVLKSKGQLNTELRIFALIRLGITDTAQIAHFLGYSLATVYSYRSKMRNRSIIEKSEFEQRVIIL